MSNFLKACAIGLLVMLALSSVAMHWLDVQVVVENNVIEPLIGVVGVLIAVVVAMIVVGLVIAGVVGAVMLAGLSFIFLLIGAVVFSGFVISWPVILVIGIMWLLLREKPAEKVRRSRTMEY